MMRVRYGGLRNGRGTTVFRKPDCSPIQFSSATVKYALALDLRTKSTTGAGAFSDILNFWIADASLFFSSSGDLSYWSSSSRFSHCLPAMIAREAPLIHYSTLCMFRTLQGGICGPLSSPQY
ncbi:hypothetical protein M404DRAFT_311914 [Pisolithus tinctorius Marx 270]|uniref:Uncharacterized protein n=1 Tax=Pisolithus tinctorius Marx 270 TaxID=870435 RepID=A0A0C3NIR1_PISTI|nr:hypothetical protein M404DRAFT_311914 [Pisolithus tinctorius Marx 270]